MRERLEQLVAEMVDKGMHYEDAQREFESSFIARVVPKCDGNLGQAAKTLGMHRNTLTRKLQALKIRVAAVGRAARSAATARGSGRAPRPTAQRGLALTAPLRGARRSRLAVVLTSTC